MMESSRRLTGSRGAPAWQLVAAWVRSTVHITMLVSCVACARDRGGTNVEPEVPPATTAPGSDATAPSGAGRVTSRLVASEADALAAIGTRVRIRGVARRQKLGVSMNIDDLSVVCVKSEISPSRFGQWLTVEGDLKLSDGFQSTGSPNGGFDQGAAPGAPMLYMASCTLMPDDELPPVRIITRRSEVSAAVGSRVRVQGIAHHQKLGDTVESGDLSVVCINPSFPPELIGERVVVEGVLKLEDYSGTSGPDEVITAGTAPGRIPVIYACTLL
jgi:hypothetical protein